MANIATQRRRFLTTLAGAALCHASRTLAANTTHQTADGPAARRIAEEMRTGLYKETSTWFPRLLDHDYGGFLCDFDARWNPTGPHHKFLEFQARITRVAAECALFDPVLARYRAVTEHGFRYLQDIMWDRKHGGWYSLLDRRGRPQRDGTKHGHGAAYAIQACVAHHRLTGDDASLALARTAFAWLDKHAHDGTHGGYHGFYLADGRPIQDASDSHIAHPLNVPAGAKDANTNIDLMDALAYLYAVAPTPLLGERLDELIAIVRDKIAPNTGLVYRAWTPDWYPVTRTVKFGHGLQVSRQLVLASTTLDERLTAAARARARELVDTSLRFGWDKKKGGFWDKANVGTSGVNIVDNQKEWWVQAEGLRALLALAATHRSEREHYLRYFVAQWDYIQRYVIDHEFGGWRHTGLDITRTPAPKAQMWKEPSHELRALMECIDLLKTTHLL